ncbi:UNVERIFIED_CONTAM: hypothetical protein Sindi_0081900 [Sesamum indicum]
MSRRRITLLRPKDEPPLVKGLHKAVRLVFQPATWRIMQDLGGQIMGAKFVFFPAETAVNGALPSVDRKIELGLVLRWPATVADVEGVAVHDADVEKCVEVEDEMSHDISPKPGDVTTAQPADVTADITADSTDISGDVTLDICKNTTTHSFANRTSIGLFIGNIPLHACGNSEVVDKIAQVFNNSSRKTLLYCPNNAKWGGYAKHWKTTAVGYFLGKRPYFHHLKEYAQSVWPALREVTATTNGFFFFQFKTVIDMEEVIEGGPWLFQGQPIVLQKWEPGMAIRKLKHTQIPIWIKLRHLPMEYWTTEGLSTVTSGVGKPLYPNAKTRACTRLDFARVCVMLDVTQTLRKHIIIITPNEDEGETPCKIDVEYEWLPLKSVYIPKVNVSQPPPATEKNRKASNIDSTRVGASRKAEDDKHKEHNADKHNDRGKAVVLYNAFDALHYLDDTDEPPRAVWNVRGLNKRDHQLALKDLVSEYRLHFLGILETRVRITNVMHIQLFLLPQWKWFVDYASVGNRIWIAWNDNLLDVHILDLGEQFIHCRITIKELHESYIITIAYGASNVIRTLWHTLETLARQCSNDPWLVGGDFNVVRDLNEHEVIGVPMYAVTRKLKALKQVFRQQRRNKGDLTRNVQLAKDFLDEAQTLVSSDRQNELFLYLEHCCRMVYAKAAKTEQIMLQQRAKMQWMKDGDQCSRIFFRKIAHRRATRRILQINDEHGTTHMDSGEVVHEFVSYYQNLLGGNKRRTLVDINYLRPWARHIISIEEASHLLSPFSLEEVKLAVFDIAEDKAPGPDGYSSGFYKAAWPIVGTEVTRAVLDFFSTGRLLKQVNSTLLALIPKVHTPMSISDFRPISYKLWRILWPAAFIPGRSIGDNIMLAQELFTGYNQARLPPRCALKVDIRKAYDTVEWDFLVATLHFFGFPPTFTRWIEECVTTASFSIGLNGTSHGFFTGARGLRQGDPLSPYLFVLVMEVLHLGLSQLVEQDLRFTFHWKCEPARIFQLGFVDDLILFCKADKDSVRTLKVGLDRFAEWSGLRLNIQKSHLIISRSAQERKEQLLSILGFQGGHLPMRYLGLPLISSRLSISDCQPLLSKIYTRIAGWEGMSLSYAGRVQIIETVLSALSLYWTSAFILPKAVIKEVEKHL